MTAGARNGRKPHIDTTGGVKRLVIRSRAPTDPCVETTMALGGAGTRGTTRGGPYVNRFARLRPMRILIFIDGEIPERA